MHEKATVQYFLVLFPEFKKVEKATVQAYLELASCRVPCHVWKENTKYATALLTAHMLTGQGHKGLGSGGGALTDESVGEISQSFATVFEVNRGDAPMMTTRYGIDFIALRKETVMTGMSTRSPYFRRPNCE